MTQDTCRADIFSNSRKVMAEEELKESLSYMTNAVEYDYEGQIMEPETKT